MTALILQARLDSSRLPGKALLPLGGRPLLFRVMEALQTLPVDRRVLACPEDCAAPFGPLAEEAGFELSPGPKEDVLRRYALAVKRFQADRLIRATGDNPFVFIDAAWAIHQESLELGADYGGYSGLPHGAGVESVDGEALLRADAEAALPFEREHVCPYLYQRPERFTLHRPLAPEPWRGGALRLTVDFPDDYQRAQVLYQALYGEVPEDERRRGAAILRVCRERGGFEAPPA